MMNPFVEASATARNLCDALGWDKGDDQPVASRALKGLRVVIFDLYRAAEDAGNLDTVVANLNRHVAQAPAARVRETTSNLINGYSGLLNLFSR